LATNALALSAIHVGVDPTALRLLLRQFHSELVAAGVGSTCGVHDFGVFYVHENARRFVVRDERVFDVPSRLVVKLRPSRADVDELDESPIVRIFFSISGIGEDWQFESVSRSDRFRVVLPIAHEDEQYDFCRVNHHGTTRYLLVRSDYTGLIADDSDFVYSNVDTSVVFARWSRDLDSFPAELIGQVEQIVFQEFTARVANDTAWGDVYGSDDNAREALAWFRQRAIDIADR